MPDSYSAPAHSGQPNGPACAPCRYRVLRECYRSHPWIKAPGLRQDSHRPPALPASKAAIPGDASNTSIVPFQRNLDMPLPEVCRATPQGDHRRRHFLRYCRQTSALLPPEPFAAAPAASTFPVIIQGSTTKARVGTPQPAGPTIGCHSGVPSIQNDQPSRNSCSQSPPSKCPERVRHLR